MMNRDTLTAFKLTLGIWLTSVVVFGLYVMVREEGLLPAWAYVWLALLAILGIALSWLLHTTIQALGAMGAMRRWVILTPLLIVVAAVQSVVDSLAYRTIHVAFEVPLATPWNLKGSALNFLIYIWLFALYAAAVDLVSMTATAQRHAREATEARNLVRQAQLEMLRLQLNPHFLFNTLNNISSLVVTGRNAQAESMIARLSRFLRATLDAEGADTAPLRSELSSIDAYMDIEATRFREPLTFEIDCPDTLSGALIPSLILQPLIENAIKYAVAPSRGAARVGIAVRRDAEALVIAVQDSGICKSGRTKPIAVTPGGGVGLRNIEQRLSAHYGVQAQLTTHVTGEGFRAEISLPFQTAPIGVEP